METEIVGRDEELAQIDGFLAQDGPRALLLEGEAGIGKTTLWEAAVERMRSRGDEVLHCALSYNESRLAFAGLADLVRALPTEVFRELAAPQARALEEALLLREDARGLPDERAAAFGFLGLVAELLKRGSVALAVDDVQWLDASSAALLGYALRRVRDEQIALVVTRRPGHEDPLNIERTRLPLHQFAVGPLSLGALHRLLRVRLGHALTRPQLLSIAEASGGNPLHALELARALDCFPAFPGSPVRLLRSRIAALPAETQEALTIAAASADLSVATLSRAGGRDIASALTFAVGAGLVTIDADAVRFTHPLVVLAAEQEAGEEKMREAHRKLAGIATTIEERAHHTARTHTQPDGEAAAMLEDAAHEVRRRGARAVAAELFEAAAKLTPGSEPLERGRRALAAAWALYEAGDSQHAESLLTPLVAELPEGNVRCEARWRLGVILDETGHWRAAMEMWSDALAASDDPGLRAEVNRSMAITTAFTATAADAVRFADEAVREADASGVTGRRAAALAARAFVAVLSGDQNPRPIIDRALALAAGLELELGEWSPSAVAAECARQAMDVQEARDRYAEVYARAIESGDATLEVWAAYGLCSTELLGGGFVRAIELADHVLDLSEQLGVMRIPAMSVRALAEAHAGDTTKARDIARTAIETARDEAEPLHLFNALAAMGLAELASGHAHEAAEALRDARAVALELGIVHATALRAFLNEAEAAVAAGELEHAEEALEAYEHAIAESEPEWARPLAHRARGVLSGARGELDVAREHLQAADASAFAAMPFERGRSLLALGQLERRAKQKSAARETLRRAAAGFDELGARPWAERARAEEARIGGRASAGDVLTATERHVAELVAEGRSNKDVAAALFVTVKAVEANLSRIYAKLGVRSRTELTHLLASERPPSKL